MPVTPTFHVIGGGLAGTLVCLELVRRDLNVTWYMDPARPPCSAVAAGMYNPITGKRFARTWQVDTLQPFMKAYYRELEEELRTRFFYPQPVMKLFTAEEERARWEQRKDEPEFQRLAEPLESHARPEGISDPGFGGFVVPDAGSVRLPTLLDAVRRHLSTQAAIVQQPYTGTDADHVQIIHCEGFYAVSNPLLRRVPFRHAHGDVLTIRAPGLGSAFIINTGIYVLPLGDGLFRVGATYDWDRTDPSPTKEGRRELEMKLSNMLEAPFEVVDHAAGIRAATDRRTPIVGCLPGQPRHAVFNGLGSKGVLLAPYYARQLVQHLVDGAPLDREVDAVTHLS